MKTPRKGIHHFSSEEFEENVTKKIELIRPFASGLLFLYFQVLRSSQICTTILEKSSLGAEIFCRPYWSSDLIPTPPSTDVLGSIIPPQPGLQ
jgi:hypothetical protein